MDGRDRALPELAEAGVALLCQTRRASLEAQVRTYGDARGSRSDGRRLATSCEEVQAGHHENVGVLEMLARRGVKLLKFLLIGQAHLDDL